MKVTLGVDVACRADHQGSLADERGEFCWSGVRFRTRVADLESLWARIPVGAQVTVVMEPTRNAWAPLASWFTRRGARVVLVPSTQSADLRAYYSKHTKNDRLDSRVLARVPLLHPEGQPGVSGAGPADPLRRATRRRASLVARRTAVMTRLDALVELLGPDWYDVLGSDYEKTALAVLARYPDPEQLLGLGPARLTAFLRKHSRGHWGAGMAARLRAAARETITLWDGALDFPALAEDIRAEAAQQLFLDAQIGTLDARIADLVAERDPQQILQSAPGVGPVVAGVIAGRIGDPGPVHFPGRGPQVRRTRAERRQLRHPDRDRAVDQEWRCAAASRRVHRRGLRPTNRPPAGRQIRPPDGTGPPPQRRDHPPGRDPAHPCRGLLACRHPLCHPGP